MTSLRERIEDVRVRTSNRYFVPEGQTARLLGEREVRQILARDPNLHGYEVQRYADLVLRSARKVLAILVLVGKEEYLVRDFLHRELYDERLPLCESQLSHTSIRDRFLLEQYTFLAPVFDRGAIHRTLSESCVLPFTINEPILNGEGAFGKVFRIEIHPAHQRLVDNYRYENTVFARKEFKLEETSPELFEAEKRMLEMLFELKHDNIVKLLATYAHGSVFNMIFPLAEMTLHVYLRSAKPANSQRERRTFFTEFCNLASALDSLHNFHLKVDGLELLRIGYHHDLKPKNILVQGQTFQIADFGLARFKEFDESSKTDWKMGTRTYGPPESGEGSRNGRAHDMWSMGCILSELVTFCILGPEGVEDFAQKRETMVAANKYNDAFHHKMRLKEEVVLWFRQLGEHRSFNKLLDQMLDLAKSLLSPDPGTRPDSRSFLERFTGVLSKEHFESRDSSFSQSGNTKTPLHNAAATGDLALLKFLLQEDPSKKLNRLTDMDANERLPIHLAAQFGKRETVMHLLELDPDEAASSRDVNGHTILHLASANHLKSGELVSEILKWAEMNSRLVELLQLKDARGKTALHLAIDSGNSNVAIIILNYAKIEPSNLLDIIQDQDDDGRTVLDTAHDSRDGQFVEHVEQYLQACKRPSKLTS